MSKRCLVEGFTSRWVEPGVEKGSVMEVKVDNLVDLVNTVSFFCFGLEYIQIVNSVAHDMC